MQTFVYDAAELEVDSFRERQPMKSITHEFSNWSTAGKTENEASRNAKERLQSTEMNLRQASQYSTAVVESTVNKGTDQGMGSLESQTTTYRTKLSNVVLAYTCELVYVC